MAQQQGGQEKTEQPTGKKLQDARKKGTVAKSTEMNTFAMFITSISVLYLLVGWISGNISDLAITVLGHLPEFELHYDILQSLAIKGLLFFLVTVGPLMFVLVLMALISGYGQVGFLITFEPMKPKFSKLNPIKGFKNKFFSSTSVVELMKSVGKLIVISLLTYWVLADIIAESIGLVQFTVADIVDYMADNGFMFVFRVSMVFLVIAVLDFLWQKHKHIKDLKMTKQEIKDEHKQQEGDPQVKSRIRGKQMEMAAARMMADVPEADVVITNPTHFAVALKYEFGSQGAPKVLAKGTDRVALKIREIAEENDIPIHEDPPLARALYKQCDIGDEIPTELFHAVARILAYIYQQKQSKKKTIV